MPSGTDTVKEQILLTWKAGFRLLNEDNQKSRSVVTVLGVLIAIILIFAGEMMLLVLMAAGAFYYIAQARAPQIDVEYSITNKGLKAFGRTYLWWEFKSWWFEPKKTEILLGLDLISGVMGRMYIPLGPVNQSELEKLLNKYLQNSKPEETTVGRMTKWVGEKFPLDDKI